MISGRRAAVIGIAVAVTVALGGARAHRVSAAPAAADTGVVSASIDFFEARLARDPGNPAVTAALAGRYTRRFQTGADWRDLERAEGLVRGMLPLARDTAGAWASLSGLLLMRHAFADAYPAAERGVAADPNDPEAQGALFDAALATGRYAVAESALGVLPPATLVYQVRLATWLDLHDHGRGAYGVLGRVCDRLRTSASAPHALAWCLTELGRVGRGAHGARRASGHYREALRALPGYRGAVEGLADLANAAGDAARAERLYRSIAADAHPDLYLRVAETLAARGDRAAARAWEAKFLRVASVPGAEALYAHALALYLANRSTTRDSALAVARRDVARRPAAESWEVLSWVLYRAGRWSEALAASDSARVHLPAGPTGDFHRAWILRALGRGAAADSLAARATADPGLLAPHARLALQGSVAG